MRAVRCLLVLALTSATLPLAGAPGGHIITTVAGGGTVSGDGVPATDALFQFGSPLGVAVDAAGNLYIADAAAALVRRVDRTTGIITTVAGNGIFGDGGDGGPATLASLSHPWGLAVDLLDNLYIADNLNNRIRKVDGATGIITTVAGYGGFGHTGDGGPATSAALGFPQGVAVDGAGNIYIADTLNWRIRKVDRLTGIITTIAGTDGTDGISGTGDGGPAVEATFAGVQSLAVDLDGNLFVVDANGPGGVIRRIDAVSGIITTVAGGGTGIGDFGSALDADLVNARAVSPDGVGNLYIAGPHRAWRVDPAGNISVYAGTGVSGFSGDGGPAVDAALGDLNALTVGSGGSVFLADTGNNRVRKVVPPAPSDTTAPTLEGIPDDLVVEATSAAGAIVNYTMPSVSDEIDPSPTLSCAPPSGSTFPIGITQVICIATDDAGNSSAAAFHVMGEDTTSPQLACPVDVIVTLFTTSSPGTIVNYPTATATDLVDPAPVVTYSQGSGTLFPIGATSLTVTAVDATGNAAQCTFTVDVNLAPVANAGADRVAEATGAAGASIMLDASSSFDPDGDPLAFTWSGPFGSAPGISAVVTLPLGTSTVTLSVDDGDAVSADAIEVTVRDTTPPAILGSIGAITTEATSAAGAMVVYATPSASDAVDPSPSMSCAPGSGGFPLGVTTVTCTAADTAGNASSESFNVTVRDTTAPLLSCPLDQSVLAASSSEAIVTYPAATATDLVDSFPLVTYSQASGTLFPLGRTPVRVTAADASGNSVQCTFTVSVNVAPVPNAGSDQIVEATTAAGASIMLDASASFDPDGDPLTFTWTGPFGTASGVGPVVTLPLGTHEITLSVQDGHATAVDTVAITVRDTRSPTLFVPGPVVVEATSPAGALVHYAPATSTDTVSQTTVVCEPVTGSVVALGAHDAVCTATDASGNSATDTFLIHVRDTTPPAFPPIRFAAYVDPVNQGYVPIGFSDYIPGTRLVINDTSPGFHRSFLTDMPRIATSDVAVDVTVQIVADENLALAGLDTGVRVLLSEGQGGFDIAAALIERPGGDRRVALVTNDGFSQGIPFDWTVERTFRLERTIDPARRAVLSVDGEASETLRAEDLPAASVLFVRPTFQIGTVDVPARATVRLGDIGTSQMIVDAVAPFGAMVDYPVVPVADLADPSPTVTCSPGTGSSFTVGAHVVTCTARDASGNTSAEVDAFTFRVTVRDTVAPAVICPPNQSVLATTLTGAFVEYDPQATASDAVDLLPRISFSMNQAAGNNPPGAFFEIGTTTVSATASDFSGNVSPACSFTVTVVHNQPPLVAAIPRIALLEDSSAGITLLASDPEGHPVSFVVAPPSHGSLSGTAPNLTYTPSPDFNGSDSFTFHASDGVNSVSSVVGFLVIPRNDPPVNTVPGPQATSSFLPLMFSGAGGNRLSVSDPDAGANPIRLTLVSTAGRATLSRTTGLAFDIGDGSADALMSFTGTIANINAALDGLRFTASPGFIGNAVLGITADDLGNSGGAALSDVDTVSITVGPDARADLDVSIEAPSIVEVGATLTYAIRVTNRGPMPASSVTLWDALPFGITPLSVTPERGACSTTTFGLLIRCDLGSLAVRQSVVVTIIINVPRQETLSNRATVLANQLDPVLANNSSTVRTVAFVELSSHQTVTDLSGAAGSERVFRIEVPPGQGGLTAISWGVPIQAPTLRLNHGAPSGPLFGSAVNNPAAGSWFVTIGGVTAYSGVSMQARFSTDHTLFLQNNVPLTSISGAILSQQRWRIAVPPGATLWVTVAGTNGDADLYVRHASAPTTAIYDCRGVTATSNESCVITNAAEGDWHIMLHAFQAYTGVTLRAVYWYPPP